MSESTEVAWAQAFGRRVAELRQQQGLRQVDLAERIGVSRSAMIDMESGQFGPQGAGLRIVRRIATELGTTVGALCGDQCVAAGTVMVDRSVIRQLEVVRDKLEGGEEDLARSLWESLLAKSTPVQWAATVPRDCEALAPGSATLIGLSERVGDLVADIGERLGKSAG